MPGPAGHGEGPRSPWGLRLPRIGGEWLWPVIAGKPEATNNMGQQGPVGLDVQAVALLVANLLK